MTTDKKTPANNATSAKPSGKVEGINSDRVPRHKRLAMGQNPETGAGNSKKTGA